MIDRELLPENMTELDIMVGTTKVHLPNIIVSSLPENIDLLLGSDWRQLTNVDVTFHKSNNVTIVHLTEDDNGTTVCDSASRKDNAQQPTVAQALVVSFCNSDISTQPTPDTSFVGLRHRCDIPDADVETEIEKAVSLMTSHATEEEQGRLRQLLRSHHEAFATSEESTGMCPHTEHSIELRDSIPVASRPYRCSPADREFIRSQVQHYLNKDIIRASESEYAAPTIVVYQPQHPTNPRQMVHDYRRLNAKAINTPYPMPVMEDVIDDVMRDGAAYFTIMDIKSAFLTVRIQGDMHKTAFLTPDDKYEYKRMAFGFCKTPQTMQSVMRKSFEGLPRTATYMDDIGQGASSVSEVLDLLEQALCVVTNGLRMDIKICQFVRTKVSFLGYVISKEGRIPDPQRVAAVNKFEPSRGKKHLYSFLQFANHFRRFIKNFAAYHSSSSTVAEIRPDFLMDGQPPENCH